mmetsp:Transcript_148769/g.361209  ORF Transcript_148769/g.361209 Transcript_148769/m.361209 type:complete len:276 (+) Transcript_148769:1142-1969(+)
MGCAKVAERDGRGTLHDYDSSCQTLLSAFLVGPRPHGPRSAFAHQLPGRHGQRPGHYDHVRRTVAERAPSAAATATLQSGLGKLGQCGALAAGGGAAGRPRLHTGITARLPGVAAGLRGDAQLLALAFHDQRRGPAGRHPSLPWHRGRHRRLRSGNGVERWEASPSAEDDHAQLGEHLPALGGQHCGGRPRPRYLCDGGRVAGGRGRRRQDTGEAAEAWDAGHDILGLRLLSQPARWNMWRFRPPTAQREPGVPGVDSQEARLRHRPGAAGLHLP